MFVRSIASAYLQSNIRTYAICPGTVRTNLLDQAGLDSFPADYFTPVSKIASTVEMLVNGGDGKDSKGVEKRGAQATGLAVEINGENHYFREQHEYCDDKMRRVMEATRMSNEKHQIK